MRAGKRSRLKQIVFAVAVLTFAASCASDGETDGTATGAATAGDPTEVAGTTNGGGGGGGNGDATLVVGTDAEPTTLDIQAIDDNGLKLATWSINEGLVDFDPEGNLEPILASAVPVMDPDDPTRWRVSLREGIEFTDGTPFNAEAVKFNIDRILDPDYGSTFAAELGTLSGAEVVDEYTIDLITAEPDPVLANRLRALRIVSPTAAEDERYAEAPVGTGPYIFESWERGQSLTLKANDDYWGEPKPTIETVETRFLPDNNTRISALQAGEIDIAINVPPALAEGLDVIRGSYPVEAGYLVFDTGEFPYSEPEFRQALQYALDLEAMNEQLFGGQHDVTNCQPVVPSSTGFNDALEPYPYDPERAQELLDGLDLPADFAVDFEGTSAVYQNDREMSETIAGYWRAVGLDVNTTLNDIDPYLEKIFNAQETGAVIFGFSDQSLNHAARQIGLFVAQDGQVGTRAEGFHPEINPLVDTALTSLDEEERQTAYDEIWRIYCDELIMGHTLDIYDVTGVTPQVEYQPDVGKFEQMDFHRVRLTE